MRLDITMTAVQRPAILERTLKSFRDNLFRPNLLIDYQLIINVDPIGELVPISYIHDLCADYFPHPIVVTQARAHFGRAFHRVWSMADLRDANFIFHLEDDWECTRTVDLYKMIDIMRRDERVAILRLSTVGCDGDYYYSMKQWGHRFPWNGNFYEIPSEDQAKLRVSGHPSLINPKFIHDVLPHMNPESNPEKQLREGDPVFGPIIKQYRFGVFNTPGLPANIRDIGREWMIKKGFNKQGNKAWFTQWEQTNGRTEERNTCEPRPVAVAVAENN